MPKTNKIKFQKGKAFIIFKKQLTEIESHLSKALFSKIKDQFGSVSDSQTYTLTGINIEGGKAVLQ